MKLHNNNHDAKKRVIGKKLILTVRTVMLQEHVDMVAGDFNGAVWRRQSGSDPRPISKIEEAFTKTSLPIPPLWGPGSVPGEWSDVCGFLKPLGSDTEWQVRMHGAFTIPFGTPGLKEKDQSCHHKVRVHLSHVNARADERVPPYNEVQRLHLKERNSPCDHSKERKRAHWKESDHSLVL